jgi:hypothetical protein
LFFCIITIIGCKKNESIIEDEKPDKIGKYDRNNLPNNFFKDIETPDNGVSLNTSIISSTSFADNEPIDLDNGDDPIILGAQVNNPYTISNMQQAYLQLYGSTAPISVTHLYIRYKPVNTDQLALLLEQTNIELQDYPMDYQVLQDGDYYQDPSLGTEDIGWLYSAVAANYTPITGIQYEVIQQLHIPANDDLLLESMAESLAGGAIYEDTIISVYRYITRIDEPSGTLILPNRLALPCDIDPCGPNCPPLDPNLPNPCGGGGGGGGTTYNPQIPRGTIQVQDQRTCNTTTTPLVNVPVRQAKIVCKRWFKIWTGYTNDQGQFLSSKKFKNNVKILLKTENSHATIKKIRGARVWQVFFPVKKRLGIFNQIAMANVNYVFNKPNPASASNKELPYWVAVTTHNSVLEYLQYASEVGVLLPHSNLKILISNWNDYRAKGITTMWSRCTNGGAETIEIIAAIVAVLAWSEPAVSIPAGIVVLAGEVRKSSDIIIGYKALNADYDCRLTSPFLKGIAYHQLGLATMYKKFTDINNLNCTYWTDYSNHISAAIRFGLPNSVPFGDGISGSPGKVALFEAWGSYCSAIFTNRHYGNGGANGSFGVGLTARMQDIDWPNIPNGLNTYLNAIENHDPLKQSDPHKWIPRGLMYDLSDGQNDNLLNPSMPIDNVSGITLPQMLNAFDGGVYSVGIYKQRLLQQAGSTQQNEINALFASYGY